MLKTILFDLDGTLLDTEPDFTLILNRLLRANQRAEVSAARVRQTVSSGARALIRLGFGMDEEDPDFSSHLDQLLALYDRQIPDTRCVLFPGIASLLQRIDSENLNWGIVTNKPSRFTQPLLARIPALSQCRVVVCPDQLQQSKPDPEGLLLACRQAASSAAEAVYVGDHPRDIEAGRNAGMKTIAAAWGYLPENTQALDWNADKVARHADDIQDYLFHH
ncbi:MAG: HAD-IA family hydrolase [Pseudomonadales bacterium]|nr:HAD-IA family hydrolase [Pseudomonadales bacterium]